MVAKITTPKSIEAALNYNEKKVQRGNAFCLYAANYLTEAKNMNFYQKLNAFERLNNLNDRATTKTLHVSLNFDPSENPSDKKLIEIATYYMDKIGFGEQPFLVYKHEDAGHPHIHIVSTTIKDDGTRISTHNIGRNQSEKARKEIEKVFGLIRAENHQNINKPGIRAVNIDKALYGKTETKSAISNIVDVVFSQYKITSLPEFNAVLKQFNVVADRGKEEGRIFKNRGLVFRILDPDGNKVGVPIKASIIGCKPTLKNLESKFELNQSFKLALKENAKNAIDDCLQRSPGTMKNLVASLSEKNIYTVLRQNEAGVLYGITFVDNETKAVFNGSDLRKGYSASALQSRIGNFNKSNIQQNIEKDNAPTGAIATDRKTKNINEDSFVNMKKDSLIDVLVSPTEQYDSTPNILLKKKRKKKRKMNNKI